MIQGDFGVDRSIMPDLIPAGDGIFDRHPVFPDFAAITLYQ
jgi:hypothetical protein